MVADFFLLFRYLTIYVPEKEYKNIRFMAV